MNEVMCLVEDLRSYIAKLINHYDAPDAPMAKIWRLPDGSVIAYDAPMTAEEAADDTGFDPEDIEPIHPQGGLQ
ncbi:MAG: hypothetical protein P3W87_004070 [Gammaproteobacteria bacterium]|nr:hypothetical protein [Gammaproteobacteria bacterium]